MEGRGTIVVANKTVKQEVLKREGTRLEYWHWDQACNNAFR